LDVLIGLGATGRWRIGRRLRPDSGFFSHIASIRRFHGDGAGGSRSVRSLLRLFARPLTRSRREPSIRSRKCRRCASPPGTLRGFRQARSLARQADRLATAPWSNGTTELLRCQGWRRMPPSSLGTPQGTLALAGQSRFCARPLRRRSRRVEIPIPSTRRLAGSGTGETHISASERLPTYP
jgi:hypothetical protein